MERVKKSYKKKKKRTILKSKIFWFVAIIFGSVIGFISLLFIHPFYQLETVNIEGVNLTSEGSLRNFIKRESKTKVIFESDSLVFVSNILLTNNILSNYPHINQVKITKRFPKTLEIKVTEREKEAVWCVGLENSICYEIDSKGIAFKRLSEKGGSFFIRHKGGSDLRLGERTFGSEKIEFILTARRELENLYDLSEMLIPHERSLFVETEEGFQIRFDFGDDLNDQLERLEILLSEEIDEVDNLEYIELRYGNSVYYKKI